MSLAMQVREKSVEDYKDALKAAGLPLWCESAEVEGCWYLCVLTPECAWITAKVHECFNFFFFLHGHIDHGFSFWDGELLFSSVLFLRKHGGFFPQYFTWIFLFLIIFYLYVWMILGIENSFLVHAESKCVFYKNYTLLVQLFCHALHLVLWYIYDYHFSQFSILVVVAFG